MHGEKKNAYMLLGKFEGNWKLENPSVCVCVCVLKDNIRIDMHEVRGMA